ncbi:MAG: glycine cleavage system aminomethyltransferase GcvT [Mariprofundales bacterium]
MTELLHTPLYAQHIKLGGKMVSFAGFSMPVQYPQGALSEYNQVRGDNGAGLFDISHMAQVRITGRDALNFVQYVATNDVNKLAIGQVQYSALLAEDGGFIDDITVYRLTDNDFYLCVNAANHAKDITHLKNVAAVRNMDVSVQDESAATTLLALQGIDSQEILQTICPVDLAKTAYYHFVQTSIAGFEVIISRTGYTGEDGFEIYLPNAAAVNVWQSLLNAGASPIGLAARDMLRTEMGYALYGHEISADVTPVEAKLMWIVKMNKGDFIGKKAVAKRRLDGARSRLIAIKITGRGIPREHYPVVIDGQIVGEITSGMHSPLSAGGVALARIDNQYVNDLKTAKIFIRIRKRDIAASLSTTPFVRSRVRKS